MSSLSRRRAELRARGRTADMIPVQEAILAAARGTDREDGAHNYLSTLYLWVGRYAEAEAHARAALETAAARRPPSTETLGCYRHVLALAIAAQGRYAEAAPIADAAVRSYRVRHDPTGDFLSRIMAQASEIRRRAEAGSAAPEPVPVHGDRNLNVFFRRPDAR